MNSFEAKSTFKSGGTDYEIYRLDALAKQGVDVSQLPFSLRILLENLLRNEDGIGVLSQDVLALAKWDAKAEPSKEIAPQFVAWSLPVLFPLREPQHDVQQ